MALTPREQQDAAAAHAERAHALLAEADAEAAASGGKPVSDRVSHRVLLAAAHARTSIALSALVLPAVGPAPPPGAG